MLSYAGKYICYISISKANIICQNWRWHQQLTTPAPISFLPPAIFCCWERNNDLLRQQLCLRLSNINASSSTSISPPRWGKIRQRQQDFSLDSLGNILMDRSHNPTQALLLTGQAFGLRRCGIWEHGVCWCLFCLVCSSLLTSLPCLVTLQLIWNWSGEKPASLHSASAFYISPRLVFSVSHCMHYGLLGIHHSPSSFF